MENENMEQEESILTLTDENGQDMDFEYLDCLTYEGKEYLVLMPADEPSTEIVILEVEPVDKENENYLAVEDEELARRKAAYVQPEPNIKTGWLARYARLVTSANQGAVLK